MATTTEVVAFEGSSIQLMARVTGNDGSAINQATLDSITCKVFDSITGSEISTPTVTIADTVFDTLQTDSRWTKDSTGYNFLHALPASALVDGSKSYRVEYKFTPASGEAWYVVFAVKTIEIMSE